MNLFRRITTTINSTMDNVVCRVEDHDAIIDASIRECRQAAVRTRARLSKVRRDGVQLQSKHDKAISDISLWADRAIEVARSDEETALKCLKYKKIAESQATRFEQSILEHSAVENKLQTQLDQIESRMNEISQKRNTLRSRQSLAEAQRIMERMDGDSGSTVNDTFERWESVLMDRELIVNDDSPVDPFEIQFIDREERDLLREELKSLSAPRPENRDE